MNWIELKEKNELLNLQEESLTHPETTYVIFKHSTRCGTSRMARSQFEREWKSEQPVYLINVVENREVSNAVETLYHVRHESPQILVIRNGECILHDSHYGINATEVLQLLSATLSEKN